MVFCHHARSLFLLLTILSEQLIVQPLLRTPSMMTPSLVKFTTLTTPHLYIVITVEPDFFQPIIAVGNLAVQT